MAQAPLQTSARTACWRHSTQRRAITQTAQLGNIRVRQTDLVCPCFTTPSPCFSPALEGLPPPVAIPSSAFVQSISIFPRTLPAPVPPVCPAVIGDKLPALCLLPKAAIRGKACSGAACPRLARRESLAGDGRHPALPLRGAMWEGALSIVKGLG